MACDKQNNQLELVLGDSSATSFLGWGQWEEQGSPKGNHSL